MLPIAIHPRPNSFSDRWIARCEREGIPFRRIDGHASDVMSQLEGAGALLWHFSHGEPRDLLVARHVLTAATARGLHVFPDGPTAWHFDDKVAQKYLLEALGAPLVPTHVFFDEATALRWIDGTLFPKVFKLKRGSGSRNVRLVHSASEARALAHRAFRAGFNPSGSVSGEAWKLAAAWNKGNLTAFLRSLPEKIQRRRRLDLHAGREAGYIYFQDFVDGNRYDTRVTVIGDRAFGFTRDVRRNDFRASGSGSVDHRVERVSLACVETAFRVARAMRSQSTAFDFVQDPEGRPLIVEVSYGYDAWAVEACPGHWDSALTWHDGRTWPEDAILDDVLAALQPARQVGPTVEPVSGPAIPWSR